MAKNTKILLETSYPRGYPAGGKVRVETSIDSKPRIGGPRFEVIKYAADGTSHCWQLWTLREAVKQADTALALLALAQPEAAA